MRGGPVFYFCWSRKEKWLRLQFVSAKWILNFLSPFDWLVFRGILHWDFLSPDLQIVTNSTFQIIFWRLIIAPTRITLSPGAPASCYIHFSRSTPWPDPEPTITQDCSSCRTLNSRLQPHSSWTSHSLLPLKTSSPTHLDLPPLQTINSLLSSRPSQACWGQRAHYWPSRRYFPLPCSLVRLLYIPHRALSPGGSHLIAFSIHTLWAP